MRYLCLLPALFAAPALADDACAPLLDRSTERSALFDTLKTSPTPAAGQNAANNIWAFWMAAPDARAQSLLDLGMESRLSTDLAASADYLDQLVTYCPDFAEGWNQRAFTRFLQNQFDEALKDIDAALKIEPDHFGALAGQAMIYFHQERPALAEIALRRAVAVHPWLNERALLNDDGEAL